MRPRYSAYLGPAVVAAAAVANLVLWVSARPSGQPTLRYTGEVFGVEAVLLFSCALVLTTLFPVIERGFGGLDRVAVWHKRVSVAGVLLMVVHPLFATATPLADLSSLGRGLGSIAMLGLVFLSLWAIAPSRARARWAVLSRRLARISHERWLTGHRLTGLFVISAAVHGALVDPVLPESGVLRVTYFGICGIGILAYLYRELLARYVIPVYDYTVAEVVRPNDTTVDVALEPTGRALAFLPGQFVFLAFGGPFGWERHPFTVASAPSERRLEVDIKAAGDFTEDLFETLKAGTPAKVVGPFGAFDYHRGGKEQIWIAGGMGVTPFLSWIRSMDDSFDRSVVFWYSVKDASEALFLDELEAAGRRHPTFRPQLIVTSRDGRLDARRAAGGSAPSADTWVFMCGPEAMTTALAKGFRDLGVPSGHVSWEKFGVR